MKFCKDCPKWNRPASGRIGKCAITGHDMTESGSCCVADILSIGDTRIEEKAE